MITQIYISIKNIKELETFVFLLKRSNRITKLTESLILDNWNFNKKNTIYYLDLQKNSEYNVLSVSSSKGIRIINFNQFFNINL